MTFDHDTQAYCSNLNSLLFIYSVPNMKAFHKQAGRGTDMLVREEAIIGPRLKTHPNQAGGH